MTLRILTALLLAMLWQATSLQAERLRLDATDQAARDPSLEAFRDRLRRAVAARNTEAVIAAACPDIYLSHGGNGGLDEFRQYLTVPPETLSEDYRDQAPAMRAAYWSALETTLNAPGRFDEAGDFWAPYYWLADLPDTLDPYSAYVVDATQVLLRSGASRNAPVRARLSHEVVALPHFDESASYQNVRLGDATTGYVATRFLVPAIGYRAQFTRSGGGNWTLCSFVAGD